MSDLELALMLTRDAINYRDEALVLAREESERRKLDVADSVRGVHLKLPHPESRKRRTSNVFTRPFPDRELAGFRVAACLFFLSAALEILGPTLVEPGSARQRSLFSLMLAAGIIEYLRIVFRMHRALQLATDGGYPVTPWFAVLGHYIPIYNIYWLHAWSVRVTQCAARNGHVRTLAYYMPTAVFALAVIPGFGSLSLRVGLFFLAAKITQDTLLRAVRLGPARVPA